MTISISGTGITGMTTPLSIDQGGTGTTTGVYSFKNRIINGACTVQQKPGLVASTIGGYGGPDRFHSGINVAGGTLTQAASTLTFNGVVKQTVRVTAKTPPTTISGSSYWHGIVQNIEGYNCYDLLGKYVTTSFIFNASIAGTYSVSLRAGPPSAPSYVTTFSVAANTPTYISFTTTAPIPLTAPIGNNNILGFQVCVGFINTGAFQTASANTNQWITGSFLSTPDTINWAATAENFIELTELQLESGTVATSFEYRPYGVELALCQRYLPAFNVGGGTSYYTGQCATATSGYICFPFKVPTRAVPTGIEIGGGVVSGMTVTNTATTAIALTGLGFHSSGYDSALCGFSVTTGLLAGAATLLNPSGRQIFFTGCEI